MCKRSELGGMESVSVPTMHIQSQWVATVIYLLQVAQSAYQEHYAGDSENQCSMQSIHYTIAETSKSMYMPGLWEKNKKRTVCLLSVYLASEYKTAASGQTIKQCPAEETVAVNYIAKVKLMHRHPPNPCQLYNIITIHETATFALH